MVISINYKPVTDLQKQKNPNKVSSTYKYERVMDLHNRIRNEGYTK